MRSSLPQRAGILFSGSAKFVLTVLLLFAGLISVSNSYAQQASKYIFQTSGSGSLVLDRNGATVNMSSGTTQLVGAGQDDARSGITSIGFTFPFMGSNATQFSASSNGAIRLGGTQIATTAYGNSFPVASQQIIAPFWGDLATASNGKVHYKVQGTSPNRVLIVEFLNMEINYNSSSANGTFQARLYENGIIEFVYGSMSVGNVATNTTNNRNYAVGFSENTGADNQFSVDIDAPYATSTSGTRIINTINATGTITGLNSASDGSRRSFTFIPNGYRSQMISLSYGSNTWCAGEARDVTVTIKNIGNLAWDDVGKDINIGLKWNVDSDYGAGPSFIVRQDAAGLAPGATATYTFPGVVPPTGAGTENLTADVVYEAVSWFANNNSFVGPGNTVITSPSITKVALPGTTTVSGGGTFCNSATITASGGLGGTIYFQGTTSGGTSTSITANPQVVTNSGTYYFRSRNASGCWGTEGSVTVTINKSPTISVQPQSQTICEGGTISLGVTATGTPAPTYQWKKNGSPIGGATSSTYSIPSAVNGDGGAYTVDVINSCSTVTSSTANVVVNIAPAVTIDPVSQTICAGQPVIFTVTATGTNLNYQWRKGGVNIGGATGSSYSIGSVSPGDAGSFDVVVSNTGCTSVTSAAATLTVNEPAVITLDPVSQAVCEGGNVTFTASATGVPGVTYQWQKNGSDLFGETASSLSLTGVTAADNGSYTFIATNDCNSATSAAAVLTVNEAPAVSADPVSQTVCAGQPVTFTVSATGTNLTYQWRMGGVDISGATSSSYTIATVAPGDAGIYDVVVSASGCASATSAAATLSVNESPVITLDPVSQTVCEGSNVTFTASASGVPAVAYQWQKDGSDIIGETSSSLTLNGVSTADNGNYTVIATNLCNSATSAAATLVVNVAPAVTVDPVSQTICAGQPVTFTVSASGTNLNYQWRKGGVDINGATSSSYTIATVATGDAGNYDVVVSNTGCADATSAAATLTVNESPVITLNPVSQTVCEGSNVTFTAAASGVPAATYQWQKDGFDIAGETSPSLTRNGVTTTDNGSYRVIATNTCGDATSTAVTLLVNIAPIVTVDPVSQTICAGQPVTFTVSATGTNLNYQWRKNGSNIGGATSTSYTIASVVTGDAGNYDVVVSNTGCSSETSATAVLVVNSRPTAVITSGNATICSATPTTISGNVTASGAWTLTLSDNQTTNGTGNGTFSFTVSPASNTTYTLTALNDANCTSIAADLTGAAVITTNPLPAAVSINPSSGTICNGQSIALEAIGTTTESGVAFSDNFAGASTLSTTGSTSGNRSQVWTRENSGSNVNSTGTFTSPNGGGMMVALSAASGTFGTATSSASTTLTSPAFSTVGFNSLTLSYYHTYRDPNVSGNGLVEISTDGATWTTLDTYTSNQGGQTSWVPVSTNLSSTYLNQPTVYVRFVYTASSNSGFFQAHAYWWAIDDIAINGQLLPLYSWTADTGSGVNGLPAGAGTPSATNKNISVNPSATTNYTLTATNPVTGCVSTATSAITVNARPTAELSGGAVYCNGQSTTTTLSLAVTGTGTINGTLSDGTAFSGTAPTITVDVTPASTTTYTIATLADANCTAIAADMTGSATVTVNARPTAVLSGGASYCNGDVTTTTLTLTVTGSGTISGTLSDGTPFSGTAPTITVDVTPSSTTTYTIATLVDENCTAIGGDMTGSATVTINPLLPVSVSIVSSDNDNEICDGASVTFTATPVNGGTTPSYQWLLNGNPVGSDQDTYTTTSLVNGDVVSVVLTSNITPCAVTNPATSNSIATIVNANQPVSVSIVSSENDNEICEGTSVTFTATPVNGGPTPSYQWLLNGNPVGTDQDTYTTTSLANGDVVSVVLTSDITPCATQNPATSNSIATIVNANQPVSVVIASDATAVCAGSVINFSLTPTNEGTNPSYQWYVNGIAVTDSTNTTFAPVLADGDVVTVVLTSNITPCATQNPATSNSIAVTISPIPTAPGPITGITDACPYTDTNIPVTFSIDPVPGVADYTWTIPANGVNIVSGQGTTDLTVTFTSAFALTNQYFRVVTNSSFPCSSAPSELEVLKNVPQIPASISGPTNVCEYVGQPITATYSIAPVTYATSYTWTAPANATIVSGQGTTSVTVSFASNYVSGGIRVTANSNCGSRAPRSLSVGKIGANSPAVINGPVNACPYIGNNSQAVYTIDAVPNATSYDWLVPAGVNIISGQGTTALTVTFNSGYNSGLIRVRSVSPCSVSGYRSLSVANATYGAPGLISGPASACSYIGTATVATYKINKVANAPGYLWTVPAGCSIVGNPGGAGINDTIIEVIFDNNFVSGSAISVQSTGCITTAASSLQVFRTTSSGTPGLMEGPTNVCAYLVSAGNPAGTIAEYKVKKAPGATSYNWTAPLGATIVAHPNGPGVDDTVVHVIYGAGFVSGTMSVSSSNGCGSSLPRLRNVTTLQPGTPGNITAVETQSCPDRIFTYSIPAMPTNTETLVWAVPAGGQIISGQGTTSITVQYGAGAIVGNVSVSAGNNCSAARTRNLSVKLAECQAPRLITKSVVLHPEVVVYPNPAQHEFNVKFKSAASGKGTLRVIDIMGRVLSSKFIAPGETIKLGAELKSGTYFIEVVQEGERLVTKVIKQ